MHGTRVVVFPLVAGLFGIALSGLLATQELASSPPPAPVRPVTDTLHGVAVTDPYRWMEDGRQEFTDWLKAQDAYTRAVLERIPGRQKIAAELRALAKRRGVNITQPQRVGTRYFYRKRNFAAEEQVPKLYVREATGTERLLVDPVTIQDRNQPWAIPGYAVSPNGRYVAYIATAGGSTVGTLRVMEVATARTLPDTIDRVETLGRLSWRPDSRAFTFRRVRALPPGVPATDTQKCPTVFLHVIGTGTDSDRPLIGCGITPRIPIVEKQLAGVSFSTASRYALGWVMVTSSRTALEFYTAPIDTLSARDVPWHRLASGDDEVTEVVLRDETAYLRTGLGAPRGKVVRTSVLHPDLAHADVVVAQSEAVIATLQPDAMPWSALHLAKDALYVRMREAGIGRLLRVPFDTSRATAVPLPFAGSVSQAFADPGDPGITFVLQSWTRAPRVYAFDPESGTVRDTGLAPNNPVERREFEVTEVKARSADGTLVPLTIVGPAALKRDNSHPTLLEGYGAYGLHQDPVFTPAVIPWLERGGLSARCHVRGDGDYGEEWHRAGRGRNKANTIADFIACAEYLVTQGYTTPARLAGLGASAGGLAIGGAITRRPDLFAVAFPVVAVSDLLRFEFAKPLDQSEEFGTVTDPEDFRAMLAVSPYHNITPGTRYPAVLALTAINDENVLPWHVAKLVARLQAATTSGKPVLLLVNWDAGHFNSGMPPADSYSFMLWQMGIPEFQPASDASYGGPYYGRWKLNVAKSDFGETLLAFDHAASGEMQMTYLGRSYRFRFDGNDYPAILGLTAAWKQIDPNTWQAVYKRGDNVWTTDTTRLSSDGKALTIDSKGITPDGGTNEHTTVYERVAGSSGLIGTWKTKRVPPAASIALELVPSGSGGLLITRPDGSCDAKFDGHDYPVHGPSVAPGMTWAVRRTGPRSFDWTTKVNGDVFAQTSFTISDDGTTLTGIGGRVADTQNTKMVFDRVDAR
jgi:prolyl oligopeptidase